MRFPSLFRTYSAFSTYLPGSKSAQNAATPSSIGDLEKNDLSSRPNTSPAQQDHQQQEQQQQRRPSQPVQILSSQHPVPPRLLRFQNLIGISVPHNIRGGLGTRRSGGENLGLYARICDKEAKIKFAYKLSTFLVNTCYLLQIIVGAALTALGAAKGPAAAVTVLGALNTILAGLLTYLKGQGLPGRLEQHFHLLRTLRERVEEVERRFAEEEEEDEKEKEIDGGDYDTEGEVPRKTVEEEVEEIVRMYKEVRQTAEDNAPGNVLPPRGAIGGLVAKVEGVRGRRDHEWRGGGGREGRFRGEGIGGYGGGGAGGGFGAFLEKGKERVEREMEKREAGKEGEQESGGGVKSVVRGLKDLKERYEEERQMVEGKGEEVVKAAEETKRKALEEVEEVKRVAREEVEKLERGMKNI